jgi:ABC-type Fe3+-hydroxamate transport system substrate-binding protein
MIEVSDDAGRALRLTAPARRIVSLVPSITETVVRLGCGDALVGVTRYCTEPAPALRHVERVGGTKTPNCERIRGLHPDLVLVNAEENRREDFDALEKAGLNVFVSFPRRVCDVPGLLEKLGVLSGADAAARRLRDMVVEALAQTDGRTPQDRQRVFCPIWKNPWMSFNRDTYADDLLWVAGGENVCRDRPQRYGTVSLDEIATTDPQVILLPDEPYVFSAKDLQALAPLGATSAHRSGRIQFIDGKALSWYGPRTAAAVLYLQRLISGAPG